jgi:hypothetical protein
LAEWDQDGSTLTDIIDEDDAYTPSTIEDDPGAVAQVERTRGLRKPEAMKDFGLCPVEDHIEWLADIEYDCQVGISLGVHDMEMQFWEIVAAADIPQPPAIACVYAAMRKRLAERSPIRAISEGIPWACENLDTEFHRKWKAGRIRFIPQGVMVTAVGGSEKVFRVKHDRGFCEFGISGTCTVNLLTMIFKVLVPEWHIILEATAGRDVTNVIELLTLTEWTPEQDLSQDTRKIEPPVRVIEESGRGIYIRSDDHLQRLAD